jgi:serine/threonine protein kinase
MNSPATAPASIVEGLGARETAGDFTFDARHPREWGALGPRYAGHRAATRQDVFITLVREELSGDAAFAELFAREMDLADRVVHPNVLATLGRGVYQGRLFYATERVASQRLDEVARAGMRFSTDELLHLGESLCRALVASRRAGISPVDPRATSVYVGSDGTVKLADLVIARLLQGREGLEELVRPRPSLSPEVARGEPADARSDIYSLGVLLYELATGRPPFEGYESRTSLVFQVLNTPPTPPRDAGAGICRDLERIILSCLAKDPEDRPESAAELLKGLEALRIRKATVETPAIVADDGGDFEIDERSVVAQGGMGVLFKGRQKSLDRAVVVKVIRDLHLGNEDYRQRFRAEAELLAQVKDGHVVQVFGAGTWKGRPFYAMELVEGQDLAARLAAGFEPDARDILHVAHGVASALRAVWKYKIVHRDIKPANVLWASDGTIKLTDFGLAKSLRLARNESRYIMGTPCYLSPEQGRGDDVDVRSDLYSLGVVLYEMAAGRPPYPEGDDSGAVLWNHARAPLPEIVGGKIPEAILKIIYRCLQKDPRDRYPTPEALLRDVEALQNGASETVAVADTRGRNRFQKAHLLAPEASDASGRLRTAMGLGDYEEALEIARSQFGAGSAEYAAAGRRARDAQAQRLQERALECFRLKRWAEALSHYEALMEQADPTWRPEVEAAIRRCLELLRAAEPSKGLDGASEDLPSPGPAPGPATSGTNPCPGRGL